MQIFLDCREIIDIDFNEISSTNYFDGYFVSEDQDIKLQGINARKLVISNGLILDENRLLVGRVINIDTPEDMQKALDDPIDEVFQYLIIETGDWHIIPLENLIAKYHNQNTIIITSAGTPEELVLAKSILEIGVDGCLLQSSNSYSFEELLAA
ncbi:MAG: 3-dehydroquinate synthase II, partial [Candidatus Kariarchaeaceae archaeon]